MPRPVWSGAISFGLVTIPIKVVPATENHSISFHQYHLEDMGRIRYRKIYELDGKQLRDDEIGKGYEVSRDTLAEGSDEELANLPLPTAKAIEIVAFVPRGQHRPDPDLRRLLPGRRRSSSAKPYTLTTSPATPTTTARRWSRSSQPRPRGKHHRSPRAKSRRPGRSSI
jgi:DNA end-binding protein Ku